MAFYLNNSRYVEEKKPDGSFEHREIKSFYIDSPADVAALPGRDQVDETSTAFCPSTGQLWVLMSGGWETMQ